MDPGAGNPTENGGGTIAPETVGLLGAVLEATDSERALAGTDLDRFLAIGSPWEALAFWLKRSANPRKKLTKREAARVLSRDVARIDAALSAQVNAILHHARFQALESSWRGLHFLVEKLPEGNTIKVKILTISWRELVRDQERALEFDQSHLFRKVYEEEFGQPGGEPFGVILADYEVHPHPGPDHPYDDIEAIGKMASVAAAAFAPIVVGAHPSILELESFADLERPLNLAKTFEQADYIKWRSLRQMEDSRFLGLTMPRVLMRLPYPDDGSRNEPFRFREDVGGPGLEGYLWGTAVYAFGAVLVKAFEESGWLATIRGVARVAGGGGVVEGLTAAPFDTDSGRVANRSTTDAIITDAQEKELGELGFIPLCHAQDSDLSVFYGNQSVQKPVNYDEMAATVNARLSAMLQYVLCVSRFAHYIKVICRDKVGAFIGPADCEEYIRRWLMKYTTSSDALGLEGKSKYPLREARVQVREVPGKPGTYYCVTHLRPHFQLDQLVSAVRLKTELAQARRE